MQNAIPKREYYEQMKKGETYSQVPVDLAQWLKDYCYEDGLKKIDIATRMIDPEVKQSINRARLTEMENGCLNTMKFLQIVVDSFYGGNYLKLMKYAINEEGIRMLKELQFRKELSAYDLDNYNAILDVLKKCFAKKSDSQDIRDFITYCANNCKKFNTKECPLWKKKKNS